MKKLLADEAITIARGVMVRLFAEGEKEQSKGAEKVWNALIVTRNSVSDFDQNGVKSNKKKAVT